MKDEATLIFASELSLRGWERDQLDMLQRDAPFSRNPVNLMLSVAARIMRAREKFTLGKHYGKDTDQ